MHITPLESRRLFAGSPVVMVDETGVALIVGDDTNEHFQLVRDGRAVILTYRSGDASPVTITLAEELTDLKRIVILANGGRDLVVVGRLRAPLRVYGGAGNDTISGGNRRDLLVGDAGRDMIYDGEGNDYLDGGRGGDTLIGSLGDDTLVGNAGTDLIFNNAGTDAIYNSPPGQPDNGEDDRVFTETPAQPYEDRFQFAFHFTEKLFGKTRDYYGWHPFDIDSLGTSGLDPEKGLVDGLYAFREQGSSDVIVDICIFLDGGGVNFTWTDFKQDGGLFSVTTHVQGDGWGDNPFVPYNVKRFNLGNLSNGPYRFDVINAGRRVGFTSFTVADGWRGAAMPDRVYQAVGQAVPNV